MKKIFLLFVYCAFSIAVYAQIPVAYWSIENAAHTVSTYTVTDQISTGAGSAITATGLGAIATNTGAGNSPLHGGAAAGLALYANANMSAVAGDPTTGATTYWQFNLTTTNLSTLTLTFDEIASAANPSYGVLYSTNGTTWTFVASRTTLNGNTLPLTAGTWGTASIALPAACNNQATLYIRIYGYARTGGNTFKVDNITVFAATTNAGAVFTTANEADIYTMVRSGGAAGQFSRNTFNVTGAATNVTINNTAATSGVSVAAANTFSVSAAATVTFGNTGIVNGAGTFNLNSGCSLVTANVGGIAAAGATGSVQSTTRTFNGAGNYTYNAAAAQVTGTGLPAAMLAGGSVTTNNAAGVTLSQTTSFASGASLNLENGAFTNTAANLVMSSGSNVNRDNGTLAATPTTYSGINLAYTNLGNNAAAVTTGNEFPAAFNGSVTVNKTGATITLQNAKTLPVLATFGNITLTTGTLASGNFNIALSGNWTNNSAATAFTPGTATVTLNGTAVQNVNGTFSTNYNNFTLNNAAGAFLGNSINVNGTLTLTSGRMSIGTNNIVLGVASPAVAGALSSANMIVATNTGQVRKLLNANGSYTYPIGDASGPNYTPITVNFSAGTYGGGAYTGANVKVIKHPNNANLTNYINRYWSIATSGITTPTYIATATYVSADVVGTEANISAGEYPAALPWIKFGVTNTVTHTLTSGAISLAACDISGISTAGPTVTSTPGSTVCSGSNNTLAATTSTGDPALTYSWAPATGLSATTGISVTATPTVSTTYTVTVTDGNGFTATATTAYSVIPSPTAVLGANNVCVGSTTTVSDATPGGLWTSNFPGIASIDPVTGLITGIAAGNANITYTVTLTGCTAVMAFTVNPLPVVAPIGGVTHQCIGLSSTLTETTLGGVWSSASAATASISGTGVVTGNALGSTTITYTYTDGFGCVNASTTPDTVVAFPVVDVITGPSSVCVNSSVILSDDTLSGVWSSSDITIATIDAIGKMTGVAAGSATISYTVTNSFGCATSVTAAETVNPLPVVAAITGPTNECAGTIMRLSDATLGGTWSSSNTSIATVGGTTGIVTGVAMGSDNISYTVSSAFGCLNSAVYPITIGNAMPASAILPADTSLTLCHGLPENLVLNTTSTSGITYQWYMNGSPISGATTTSYIVTVPGQYILQLNNGTCLLNMPYTDVIAPPNPIIGYNSTGPSLFTGSFATYQWFLNGVAITTISSGSSSAVYPVTLNGSYTVVVSDANGCFDTSAAFVYPTDTLTTGVSTISGNSEINIFPNPASSMLHIDAPMSVNVSVMSIDGKIIMEQKKVTDINIAALPNGMYIIRIYDDKNMLLKNQKFTKIE